MMIVDQLVVQHQTLRNKAADTPESVDMNEVMALMDQVQAASAHVENVKQREQLQAILFHWNGYVHVQTGTHPGTQLAPFTPVPADGETEEQGTARVTTSSPDMALPQVHWAVWLVAIVLFVGGAIIVIWPLVAGGDETAVNETQPEVTAMMETAVPANQTAQSLAATSTRAIELQATAAAEALQIGSTTPPAQPQTTPASTGPVTYIVKQGDTLFRIAARYGTTVNEIMRLNGLSSEGLAVGQSLTLPNPPLTPEAGGEIVVTAVSPDTPIATPSGEQFVELVIRQTATSLHSGPGPDFSEIMPLQRGTFAFAVGRNPSGDWYLIQLEDGFTRGWLPTVAVGLLSPAVPEMIPIITTQ